MDIQAAIDALRRGRDRLLHVIAQVGEKLPPLMLEQMRRLVALNEALIELLSTFDALHQDVDRVNEQLKVDFHNQVWRRAVFRAGFAWVEGTLFGMKRYALEATFVYRTELSDEEVAVLTERRPQLGEKGIADTQPWYLDTRANMLFTFRTTARCHGGEFDLDRQSHGWREFLHAYAIRNRITHPKSLQQLEISDEEMFALVGTFKWFLEQIGGLFGILMQEQQRVNERITRESEDMKTALMRSYLEPASRIAQIEKVQRLLDALPAQPAEGGQLTQESEALAALEELKQYFLGQMPTKLQ